MYILCDFTYHFLCTCIYHVYIFMTSKSVFFFIHVKKIYLWLSAMTMPDTPATEDLAAEAHILLWSWSINSHTW